MENRLHTAYSGASGAVVERNRVLRNTYMLLGLSMLPTVAGALIGVQSGFWKLFAGSPIMAPLLFLVGAFGMMWAIGKNRDSGLGVALLLGFTFFMGLMLSVSLAAALRFSNGGTLIAMAAGGTGIIFASLATLATVTKKDFSFMGKFLFVGVILLLVASIANLFFAIPALALTISAIGVLLFSAYILYDISQIVNGGETNYVIATLQIYLDIYNVFVNLLSLLMAFSGERD
ncbi:modulator of FtsH protease [Chitinivorax tropicus]|uniref:Modulator of FtsH protease n=1 Tax=Chitinivorax tropicus TaxID=714531 RepID=A0A840MGE7_9PROT|nr:Bax inhibitor-1/YccA family protein [Chitinivorax tropicus]MBB5017718.1 modulator of FtsH protease [Chitinivorax tropicus]